MQCVLCGKDDFEIVSTNDSKSSDTLIVSLCKKCGLIQQTPIPTSDALKIYYSHNYRVEYKKTYTPKPKHILRAAKTAMQRINFLSEAKISTGKILDIGAGGGEFTCLSQKMGFESQGIEPNVGYSEYAKNEYDCDIRQGELEDIEGQYEVITIFHVLEHLPSPTKAFERLHHLLKEDGILFVEVPWIETNDASPHNIFFKAHIFYFSVDTLISCASQYFDVMKVDTTSNLKILFRAKKDPTPIELPPSTSADAIRVRIKEKGWVEYLFKGQGLLKPIRKVVRSFAESKVKKLSGKQIIDIIFKQYVN
jgi:2-polyprenyl-3-methyl-5-hydroxy-6-metoxy-1,4-benzoquinol methylase